MPSRNFDFAPSGATFQIAGGGGRVYVGPDDIHRRIEEVIKVDQTDEEVIRDEIAELFGETTIAIDEWRAHAVTG